jgi:hypothetical protein
LIRPKLPLEFARGYPSGIALEVSVNVVRVGLGLRERPVEINAFDTYLPKLAAHRLGLASEAFSPFGVPLFSPRRFRRRPYHQDRLPKLLESNLIVSGRKEPLISEIREHSGHSKSNFLFIYRLFNTYVELAGTDRVPSMRHRQHLQQK